MINYFLISRANQFQAFWTLIMGPKFSVGLVAELLSGNRTSMLTHLIWYTAQRVHQLSMHNSVQKASTYSILVKLLLGNLQEAYCSARTVQIVLGSARTVQIVLCTAVLQV